MSISYKDAVILVIPTKEWMSTETTFVGKLNNLHIYKYSNTLKFTTILEGMFLILYYQIDLKSKF